MTLRDDLPPLRDVIRRYGLAARKSLGQNFLLDLNLTARIARAAGPLAGVTVVEIGPGPGGLTRALLALGAERVIAVERDARAIAALSDIATHYPGRLMIIAGDALAFDPRPLLAQGPARIVANLPYNIATPLLTGWLATEPWPPWFDRMVLMFQREVAERLVAAPASKAYGRLSILTQWRTVPSIAQGIRAAAQGHLVGRRARAAPGSACLQPPRARTRDRGGVRPAAQNAAPESEDARRRSGAPPCAGRDRTERARRGDSG